VRGWGGGNFPEIALAGKAGGTQSRREGQEFLAEWIIICRASAVDDKRSSVKQGVQKCPNEENE
jgi:hypothetical protein